MNDVITRYQRLSEAGFTNKMKNIKHSRENGNVWPPGAKGKRKILNEESKPIQTTTKHKIKHCTMTQ